MSRRGICLKDYGQERPKASEFRLRKSRSVTREAKCESGRSGTGLRALCVHMHVVRRIELYGMKSKTKAILSQPNLLRQRQWTRKEARRHSKGTNHPQNLCLNDIYG